MVCSLITPSPTPATAPLVYDRHPETRAKLLGLYSPQCLPQQKRADHPAVLLFLMPGDHNLAAQWRDAPSLGYLSRPPTQFATYRHTVPYSE